MDVAVDEQVRIRGVVDVPVRAVGVTGRPGLVHLEAVGEDQEAAPPVVVVDQVG